MLAALASQSLAFQAAPVARPVVQQRAAAANMAIEDMPGKYAIDGALFDPLGLSNMFDVKWLREAELKHGRLCMVAWLGYVAVDLGFKIPGKEAITSFDAHNAAVGPFGGAMGQILFFVSLVEILAGVPAANYTMNGGDREPVRASPLASSKRAPSRQAVCRLRMHRRVEGGGEQTAVGRLVGQEL